MNNLSEANLVAHKIYWIQALSVDNAITFLTFLSIAISIKFIAPIIFVLTASKDYILQ